MPKTKSKLTLSQRREKAYELFARGYTNKDVKERLHVSNDTVANYRKQYNERIHAQAAANPKLLQDVVSNVIRTLEELDQIRADAWKKMEPRTRKVKIECPECGHRWKEVESYEVSDQTRAQYLNVLLKAQNERNKLFGVIGIKQEAFSMMMQTQIVQNRIIEWMMNNLEGDIREALANFLETELSEYMQNQTPLASLTSGVDVVDAELIEG